MPKDKEVTEFSFRDESSQELTEDPIRLRAYQLYEERGCEPGHDLDDWLQAEAEIMGKRPVARADMSPTRSKAVTA